MQETIIFQNLSGTFQIDFKENGRIDKFGSNFKVEAFSVDVVNKENKILGMGISKTCFGSLVTSVELDGVSGSGFIRITKTQ